MANVYFKEGTQSDYESITPDEHTFYKADDDVYLGGVKLSNEADLLKILEQIEDLEKRVYDLENSFYLFEGYTCQQVANIVQAGEAEDYWSVGDVTEPIPLNGPVSTYTFENESYKAMIIGFDHNMDLETGGKHGMTLQFGQNDNGVNICFRDPNYDGGTSSSKTGFRMNDSNTNSGGWESCWMRSQIMEEFYEVLPSSLQNVIGTTIKYTDNVGGTSGSASNISTTEDKIFLLAETEVFNAYTYANTSESNYTERYAWYSANDSTSARIRYKHFDPSSTSLWWLRSPDRTNSVTFCSVYAGGTANANNAAYSYGLAPAFQIF